MSPAPTSGKICIVCGQDCSHKPRSKDRQGRYTCDDCSTRRKADSARNHAAPAPAAADEIIPFLEEDSAPSRSAAGSPCPHCARPMMADAIICMGCGFNRSTGRNVTTAMEEAEGGAPTRPRKPRPNDVVAPLKCKKCGYDLSGLKSLTCPECGTLNHLRTVKRERELAESKRQARKAWIAPVIMFVVGLSISTGIVALAGGGPAVLAHLVSFGLTLVIAGVVYFVCSLLWIGFDEPLPMTALRLMGVVALGDIGFTLVDLSPFRPFYIWIIPTIIYCAILAQVMEVDYEDAVIVAVATGVLKVFAVLYIMHLLGML
jgi:hypothetical protein